MFYRFSTDSVAASICGPDGGGTLEDTAIAMDDNSALCGMPDAFVLSIEQSLDNVLVALPETFREADL